MRSEFETAYEKFMKEQIAGSRVHAYELCADRQELFLGM